MSPVSSAHQILAGVSRVAALQTLRQVERPISVVEVATAVGLHPNTMRGHLELLVEAGFGSRAEDRRGTPGRPRVLYAAGQMLPGSGTAPPFPGSGRSGRPDGYQLLAEILAGHLAQSSPAPGAEAERAGLGWGRWLAHRGPTGEAAARPVAGAPGEPVSPVDRALVEPGQDRLARQGGGTPAGSTARAMALLDRVGFAPELADGGRTIRLHRCPFLEIAREHSEVVCAVHLGLLRGALAELRAPVHATGLQPFVEPGACVAQLGAATEAGESG